MKQTILEQVGNFFVKNFPLLFSLLIGTTAKIAIDSRTKVLSKKGVVVTVVLSFFCGYLSSVWMNNHGYQEQTKWAVPIITLLGESITVWIMGNAVKIIHALVGVAFPSLGIKNKKQDI